MNRTDRIEFYSKGKLLLSLNSSLVPPVGAIVSIAKQTWEVLWVSYAVDFSASITERYMCVNIAVKKVLEVKS